MKGSENREEEEIWLERNQEEEDILNDSSSIFYTDFPPLPDFPCMSSSSSSTSSSATATAPAPPRPIASTCSSSSSSSAASWALLKSDAEDHHQAAAPPPPPLDDGDCMDVMETFGYMELIDSNEIWDPSCIFQTDNPQNEESPLHHHHHQQNQQFATDESFLAQDGNVGNGVVAEQRPPSDELGSVFFEWLKSNKEYISAEDMRSIKLKKSTVECASKRLGGTSEGRKQLLKLILEWVEQYQLQKKQQAAAATIAASSSQYPSHGYQDAFQNPNPNSIPTPDVVNTCFLPSSWMPAPPYVTDPAGVMAVAPPGFHYGGDPYSCGGPSSYLPADYQMLDSAQTWPPSEYAMAAQMQYNSNPNPNPFPESSSNVNNIVPTPQGFGGYGNNQYPLMRMGPSATKEARKKRMARQKRFPSHHRHHHNHHQHNQHQNQNADHHQHQHHQQAGVDSENCTVVAAAVAQSNPAGNWVYWPNAAAAGPSSSSSVPVVAADAPLPPPPPSQVAADRQQVQAQNSQERQVSSERRQGWKHEKNLKFLLQKVLKQSDVGNLGRIVLPKKEAETHLPELEARDGIPIAMEDIGTSQVWNMRYRFWPNNKSRMYLLENTGDFVRANGLQEGDFIVIYSDVKCGKYLIRGVKVRQPGPKSEAKKPSKGQRNLRTAPPVDGKGSPSQPSQREY